MIPVMFPYTTIDSNPGVAHDLPRPGIVQAARLNLEMQNEHVIEVWCREPHDYPEALADLWTGGLIIVEHDILPWPGALDSLRVCHEPYCAYPYIQGDRLSAFLGCTKFDGPLEFPVRLTNRTATWQDVDIAIGSAMKMAGLTLHLHWPAVVHLNPAYRLDGRILKPMRVLA